jgi:hypothetical protein
MVTGLQRRHATAYPLDHARAFMTIYGRTRYRKEPVARVYIGLANAARYHAYQDFLRSWLGNLQRFDRPVSMTLGHHGCS